VGEILTSVEECVDRAIDAMGPDLVVAAPLGLGKPVQLLNAFYRRAAADASLSLHIITALCLEVPRPAGEIEAALFETVRERLFGDYEELAFYGPYRDGRLPPNITVSELYFRAGSMKNRSGPQQNYISSNYTHIARDMVAHGVNVLVQMVAAREEAGELALSLSCNTDLTLELPERFSEAGQRPLYLAQTHDDLPFMGLDAEISADAFDFIVRNTEYNRTLFAVPNPPVPQRDYAMALHASSLVVDGGTLQIGIGSLGDAVAHACILRHRHNARYGALLDQLCPVPADIERERTPFHEGLYVSTEMFVNGMMHLVDQDIVKRAVYDNLVLQRGINAGSITARVDRTLFRYCRAQGLIPAQLDASSLRELRYWGILAGDVTLTGDTLEAGGRELVNDMDDPGVEAALLELAAGRLLRNGRILHAGFFLGPAAFYERLRHLEEDLREQICMTGVNRTNQLLLDYPLYSAQRLHARFINTGMLIALNGSVASDTLEDGTVISGVGGQYNFVAMAHDLPGARSILCIRSTRGEGKQLQSNVVPMYGAATIPRHLRDIVVTEYGVADLRGQSDAEVVKRLVNVADARFQEGLLEFAKARGKLPRDYTVPARARQNTPEHLQRVLAPLEREGLLPEYPFGSELTEQERALIASLRAIKARSEEPAHFIASAFRALLHKADPEAARPFLERIHLEHPGTTREFLIQQLLLLELEDRGLLKVS